jgi:hypothetical protein
MRVPGASFTVRTPVLTEMLGLTAVAGGIAAWSALHPEDGGGAGQARVWARAVGQ